MSDPELLRQLDQLEAESNVRREELRQIATQLPAAVSRRAVVRSAISDLRNAPNKGEIVRRGARKLMRAPLGAWRRVRQRFQA